MMRATSALVGGLVLAMLGAAPAAGGIEPLPQRTELDAFTCRELLVLQPEMLERALIYLCGVAYGRRVATAYDAEATGPPTQLILASCLATPPQALLDAQRVTQR